MYLTYQIPVDQLRSIGPNIDQVYLKLLAEFTQTTRLGDPKNDFRYEQGDAVERIASYGDDRLGLTMSAEPIQSGYGIHGEAATWKFIGLPSGVELIGYSRIDYRGLGKQYIALVVHSTDSAVFRAVSAAFQRATAI